MFSYMKYEYLHNFKKQDGRHLRNAHVYKSILYTYKYN